MNARCFSVLFALAVLATATTAEAAVIKVSPGESIQAAIDVASPGDTILVEPGVYEETGNAEFGLRITTDNLRLIGKVKKGLGEAGKVRLIQFGTQYTGVYAAPAGCGPEVGVGGCPDELQGFYIRGFTVEDFPGQRDPDPLRERLQDRFATNLQETAAVTAATTGSTRPSPRTGWSRTTSPTARRTPRCGWRPPRTFASSATNSSTA